MRTRFWSGTGTAIGIVVLAVAVRGQALPALGTAEPEVRERLVQSIFAGIVPFVGVASRGGAMVFVNPDYEQKSSEWKMCFRAGRAPVAAARAAGQAWLKELGR